MYIQTSNTIIYCLKWQETVDFYKNRLQLKVLTAREWFVEFELTTTARLSIADAARTSISSSEGKGITLAMEVEDIEATHAVLLASGLKSQVIRDHAWGARVFYLLDPEGNRLEFWSPADRASAEKVGPLVRQ
jgi:catechol 2,3-dioxygenase-like lactoylglutathione lyase family enzyme